MDDLLLSLGSNLPPTPTQVRSIRAAVEENQRLSLLLKTKISHTRAILKELERQYSDLESRTTQYRAALSPMRLLPFEILGEIFLYLTPTLPLASHATREVVERPPFALATVCHNWRKVALSLPVLWSTLDIRLPSLFPPELWESETSLYDEFLEREGESYSPRDEETQAKEHFAGGHVIESTLEWVVTSIRRSGNHPLSFRLWADGYAVNPIFDLLLKYSARWGQAFFVDVPLNLMRQLREVAPSEVASSGASSVVFHFSLARSVSAVGLAGRKESFPLGISLDSLTEYNERFERGYGNQRTKELTRLGLLSNLVVLRLQWHHSSDTARPPSPVPLLNLRIACFDYHPPTYSDNPEAQRIATLFDMPVLEAYNLTFWTWPTRSQKQTFSRMLPQSPHLKILRLSLPYLYSPPAHDMQSAVRMYPNLRELAIDIPNRVTSSFLRELSVVDFRRPLFPRLQSFCVTNRSLVHDDPTDQWTLIKDSLSLLLVARFSPSGACKLQQFSFVDGLPSGDRQNKGERDLWVAGQDIQMMLKKLRDETLWNIKVGKGCIFPRWDELTLSDL